MFQTFMLLFAKSLVVVLLLGGRCQTASSSANKLVRRHSHSDHRPYTAVYVMPNYVDFSEGPLEIFNPDGTLAYKYDQGTRDMHKLFSFVSLSNPTDQQLITLTSNNYVCAVKTTFQEPISPSSAYREYKIDPRGPKSDKWSFSFVKQPMKEKVSYVLKRNFTNKGGKLYQKVGEKDIFVAKLQEQIRWEDWLHPGTTGTNTYTLSLTADAPELESLLLMGMVMVRVYKCGL